MNPRGRIVASFASQVSDEGDIEDCMALAERTWGHLDILVNNAVWFCFGHLKGAGNGSKTGLDRDITDEDCEYTTFHCSVRPLA